MRAREKQKLRLQQRRQAGVLGGHARAKALTAEQRRRIARKGARARWAAYYARVRHDAD